MKKRGIPILLALVLVFQMAGCGGGAGNAGGDAGESHTSESMSFDSVSGAPMEEYDSESPADLENGGLTASEGMADGSVYDGSKLILRGFIQAEATDFDLALSGIEQQVAKAGGYMESSSVQGSTGSRWAALTIRVPREQFDSTFDAVGENCHITERSRTTENVSADYYDTEARKTALEIKRDRLLALLEKADVMEDIITLENALSEVQYELENLTGTLRGYDRLIAFSTLEISLSEVRDLSVVQDEDSFLSDLKTAAVTGTRSLVDFVQGVVLTVVYGWWFFLLLLLTALFLVRRMRRHRREEEERAERMRSPLLRETEKEQDSGNNPK